MQQRIHRRRGGRGAGAPLDPRLDARPDASPASERDPDPDFAAGASPGQDPGRGSSRDLDAPRAGRTLGFLLRAAYERLADHVYGQLSGAGFPEVRVSHSSVFRHIRPGGSRVTDLAERAGMAKQSMGYLVDHLVAHGYAELVPDPSDGRARLVKLSRRGNKLLDTLVRLSAESEAELGRVIGEPNLGVLRAGLERFVLGAGAKQAAPAPAPRTAAGQRPSRPRSSSAAPRRPRSGGAG
ncbi:MAG: MarR family winged helix-turn-helix transcriptional regulator [Burkholderiaceae bacterium]